MNRYPGADINLLLGRGGVRGIAIAGAVCTLQSAGYRFQRVAGISAGGFIAALVAVGYSQLELRQLVWEMDFARLRDGAGFGRVPVVGPAWRLATRMGLYDGDALLRLVRTLLGAKGVVTFGDIPAATNGGSRLQILAADITRSRMIVLPDDAPEYGLRPEDVEVALAVRMSCSLPLLFRPVRFGTAGGGSLIVDGGILPGIPFALFESARDPRRPTLAVQAGPDSERRAARPVRGPLSLVAASYYAALNAADHVYRFGAERNHTIDVECGTIGATRFGLRDEQKWALFDAGAAAANGFLERRTPAASAMVNRPPLVAVT
jgi:NTE family protein